MWPVSRHPVQFLECHLAHLNAEDGTGGRVPDALKTKMLLFSNNKLLMAN